MLTELTDAEMAEFDAIVPDTYPAIADAYAAGARKIYVRPGTHTMPPGTMHASVTVGLNTTLVLPDSTLVFACVKGSTPDEPRWEDFDAD